MNTRRLFVVQKIMDCLPSTRCFPVKRALLRWAGGVVGNGVGIVSSARFQLTGTLSIGNGTWIGHEVLIVGGEADVVIGSQVDLGPRVTLVTGTHDLWDEPGRAAGRGFSQPITIKDGAWIGAGATILGGVTVGERSMVAAGAVATHDVPADTVVGGVPARSLESAKVGKLS
jgi:maltose O-acetyltransferase